MPRMVKVDDANKIVRSIYIGDISDADVLAQVAEISALQIPQHYCELVDLTEVGSLNLSNSTIRQISKTPSVFDRNCKRVILVTDSVHYGIGRMVQTYAELSSSAPFEVVYSREEAMSLLNDRPE